MRNMEIMAITMNYYIFDLWFYVFWYVLILAAILWDTCLEINGKIKDEIKKIIYNFFFEYTQV